MNIFTTRPNGILNRCWMFFFLVLMLIGGCLDAAQVRLFLVRHGETDWNEENRIQGHTDIPLNDSGVLQAKAVAAKLTKSHPDLQAIYASDLQRAYATAVETAQLLNISVVTSPALRGRYYGSVEGELFADAAVEYQEQREELQSKYASKRELWKQTLFLGAETEAQVMERIRKELTKIAQHHADQKVAIFSHRGAIRSFIADIQDCNIEDITLPNGEFIEVIYDIEKDSFSAFLDASYYTSSAAVNR